MSDFVPHPLYFITHPPMGEVCNQVRIATENGIRMIQIRMKNTNRATIEKVLIQVLHDEVKESGIQVIINDHVSLAEKYPLCGVHLGKDDRRVSEVRALLGPSRVIGGTANTLEQMVSLADEGVDYIGLGPYRQTRTKEKLAPILGLDGIASCISGFRASGYTLPVYAIGGIQAGDVARLRSVGATGVAVSSSLCAGDMQQNTKLFMHQLEQTHA